MARTASSICKNRYMQESFRKLLKLKDNSNSLSSKEILCKRQAPAKVVSVSLMTQKSPKCHGRSPNLYNVIDSRSGKLLTPGGDSLQHHCPLPPPASPARRRARGPSPRWPARVALLSLSAHQARGPARRWRAGPGDVISYSDPPRSQTGQPAPGRFVNQGEAAVWPALCPQLCPRAPRSYPKPPPASQREKENPLVSQ